MDGWSGVDTPVITTRAPAVLIIFILTSFLAYCYGHRPWDSLDAHEQLGLVQGKASESAFGNQTSNQVQQVFWCTVHHIVHNMHPLDKMSSCTRRIRLAGFVKSCCRSLCCTFMSSQSCHQYEFFQFQRIAGNKDNTAAHVNYYANAPLIELPLSIMQFQLS